MTTPLPTTTNGAWGQEWLDAFLRCPDCQGPDMRWEGSLARCSACGRELPLVPDTRILANLPDEPAPAVADDATDVGSLVRRFYEQHPFPNYDGYESVGDLLSRASRSLYAAMLDRQIPVGARILEVGCGTGQLGLFLSVGGRAVVGADMTRASLRLGSDFATRHGLTNHNLLHGSLFDLPLKSEAFDLVIVKGVLMTTSDPRAGFEAVLRMLRPGGYVICGLYNTIGRIPTRLRGLWFRMSGQGRAARLDPVLRDMAEGDSKKLSWYLDQYAHPHETRHSVDEVMTWFAENDIELLQGAPPLRLRDGMKPDASLFAPRPSGTWFSRQLTQAKWMFTIGREGALFDLIGRKRGGEGGR